MTSAESRLKDSAYERAATPLARGLQVAQDFDPTIDTPGELNRHAILHGVDCSYATEINALKSIALIDHVDWITKALKSISDQGKAQSP